MTQLTVSMVEKKSLRYTGLDVKALGYSIEVSIQEYVNSSEDVDNIRKTDPWYGSLFDVE